MTNVLWIMRRELASYLRSPVGYVIITAALVLDGLLFNAFAVGTGSQLSSEVLGQFFFYTSGVVVTASVFVAMRLIAEERQSGTLVLLATSPMPEYQVVLGKFLSALGFIAVLTLLTAYMPALVLINGKISLGHLAAGYLGVLLLAAAALALGLVCSALAPNQLVAAILGGGVVVSFILLWMLSRIASPPVEDLLAYLSLHDKHFRPFMRGIVSTQDVVFYVSLTYVALLGATRALEARR